MRLNFPIKGLFTNNKHMSIKDPNSNVLEILEQTEGFSYDDLDDLVYFLQGRQIKMMDNNN